MTLDQLRVFLAVGEREHLTKAASALHLTPSAVSAAVQALEQRHGAKLFDRIGRRIELTEAGRVFLGEARAVLARAREAETILEELGEGLLRGALSLAASQTLASYWLPPAMMRFAQAHPSVSLRMDEGNTRTVADAVLFSRVDLGFIEGKIDEPALASTPIAKDRLIIVASPDNALTKRTVGVDDLAGASWVMREAGSGTRAALEDALASVGVSATALTVVLELPTNEAVCSAVRFGSSLTVVSELVARRHIEAARLRRVAYDLPPRWFTMLRHKERHRTKASLAFEAILARVAQEDGAPAPVTYDI